MPTASGFDRNNYGTTYNFSKYTPNGHPNPAYQHHHNQHQTTQHNQNGTNHTKSYQNFNEPSNHTNTTNNNNNNNISNNYSTRNLSPIRNGHSYKKKYVQAKSLKAVNTTDSSLNNASVDHTMITAADPNSVNIKDPNLRELVQKLVRTNDGI